MLQPEGRTGPARRLALIAMPWSAHARPSAALGALSAYVAREVPDVEVVVRSEYAHLAGAVGFELYEAMSLDCYDIGEQIYMAQVYPERRLPVREAFVAWGPAGFRGKPPGEVVAGAESWGDAYDWIEAALHAHVEEAAERLRGIDVLGLTTSFGQLFANVALARAVKARSPETIVVLGGSTVSGRVGPSILAEYECIDFVVQGEGERPLVALLQSKEGGPLPPQGILSRGDAKPAALWEVDRLDDLPVPDYDEYAALALERGIDWWIPVEGSRGCWWDRTKRAGNPKSTCYFCNLNVQWNGYREKSVTRVVEELDELSDRYANTNVYFLDNIIRARGVTDLANAISGLEKDFSIFYEMRANVSPMEILLLWESGLSSTQFGIEALSNAVLKRIGKGTTVMQNLQVMRTCEELGVANYANVMIDFPGCTAEDVEETRRAIRDYAIVYRPCDVTRFHLGVESTVDQLRSEFGVTNVRNTDKARAGLPEPVFRRLHLLDLSFDRSVLVDWSSVEEACAAWKKRHRDVGGPLLQYQDGRSFLRVEDRRSGYNLVTFDGLHREIYLACMEARRRDELVAHFAGVSERDVDEVLGEFVDASLMYREGNRYLSLATASRPAIAARRMRATDEAFAERRHKNSA